MSESFRTSTTLPVSPEQAARDWLDSEKHAAFTGAGAQIDARVGGSFSAWDGYISGTTLAITPGSRITQSWRTTEFPDGSPDSRIEVRFDPAPEGCLLTIDHSQIPDGQAENYRQGWEDFYFQPMQEYYAARGRRRPTGRRRRG